MQWFCKFKERPYSVGIEVAFGKNVLACINNPGLRNGKDIILGLERIPALAVYFPDL